MPDPKVLSVIDSLEEYARAFDQISSEQDAQRSSAVEFVRWLQLETTVMVQDATADPYCVVPGQWR